VGERPADFLGSSRAAPRIVGPRAGLVDGTLRFRETGLQRTTYTYLIHCASLQALQNFVSRVVPRPDLNRAKRIK
jgi:hypothetical protein